MHSICILLYFFKELGKNLPMNYVARAEASHWDSEGKDFAESLLEISLKLKPIMSNFLARGCWDRYSFYSQV